MRSQTSTMSRAPGASGMRGLGERSRAGQELSCAARAPGWHTDRKTDKTSGDFGWFVFKECFQELSALAV